MIFFSDFDVHIKPNFIPAVTLKKNWVEAEGALKDSGGTL